MCSLPIDAENESLWTFVQALADEIQIESGSVRFFVHEGSATKLELSATFLLDADSDASPCVRPVNSLRQVSHVDVAMPTQLLENIGRFGCFVITVHAGRVTFLDLCRRLKRGASSPPKFSVGRQEPAAPKKNRT